MTNLRPIDLARDAVAAGMPPQWCPYPPFTARAAEYRRWFERFTAERAIATSQITAAQEAMDAREPQPSMWERIKTLLFGESEC